jgi:ribosome maturation factor RimP
MKGRGDESPLSFFLELNMDAVKTKIEQWLAPLLAEKNFFLVDIKVILGKKIEVYVDSDEGIHIDDCATISRFLEKNIDGSGLVPENYVLEVSSPGMSNPLKVPRQYKRRIGRTLEILKTDGSLLEGKLTTVDDDKIVILQEPKTTAKKKASSTKNTEAEESAKELTIKYSDIKRALLQFKF